MIYRQKKSLYSISITVTVIVLFILISRFIQVPLQVKTISEVFPKEKWLLTRGNGGQIISHLIDYTRGHSTQYDISQFERGEFVKVDFSRQIQEKKNVSIGDTIVLMKSSDVQDKLVEAEGALSIATANLSSQNSAEKEPLIREAETKINYTEEKLKEQKVLTLRAKQLFEKGYASQQEYELQKWNEDLLQIESKIYHAQLENLRTGVKPEDLKLLEAQINSSRARLNFLKERENQLIIRSPISGTVFSSFSPDTLLSIFNYDHVVLHIPVKVADLHEFTEGQKVGITIPQVDHEINCEIISIGKEVKMISNQQTVFISALLENSSRRLLPGMLLESTLKLRDITLFDQMMKLITN